MTLQIPCRYLESDEESPFEDLYHIEDELYGGIHINNHSQFRYGITSLSCQLSKVSVESADTLDILGELINGRVPLPPMSVYSWNPWIFQHLEGVYRGWSSPTSLCQSTHRIREYSRHPGVVYRWQSSPIFSVRVFA